MRKWFLLTAGNGYSEVTHSVLADHGSDANYVGKVREEYGPLVAAAPEMLTMLRFVEDHLELVLEDIADGTVKASGEPQRYTLEKVRTVIAKAEGK